MRRYETILIAADAMADEYLRETVEKLRAVVVRMGGKVVRTDFWGRRTLAYEIQKSRKGQYVLLVYVAGHDVSAEVERTLSINESIIRFHTVKVADDVNIDAAVAEESLPAPIDLFGESAERYERSDRDRGDRRDHRDDDDDDSEDAHA